MSVAIVAFGAVSALGEGAAAASAGEPGAPARVALERDPELVLAGLARPFAARAKVDEAGEDRAVALLARAAVLCRDDLDRVLPSWRGLRVGIAVGTSSGALRSAEGVFSRLRSGGLADVPTAEIERSLYFAPLLHSAKILGVPLAPATLVLGACAAAGLAIGLGKRWLEAGRCDVVLAGGFDAVSVLVAAGFEALRATTSELPPRPFRLPRDGMALGEGAALLALVRPETAPRARAYVTGFGASSDAVHLTAPDRTGHGLARAAARALDEAGRPAIDLVSAHATATPFSDAAEARAIRDVLGEAAASSVVVHPFKAQAGHTLGAAGALESLVCVDALERGILPAAAGEGPIDPDTPLRLLAVAERGAPTTALKLSAAFGGANAALVISKSPSAGPGRERREVYASRAVHVAHEPDATSLASELGQLPEKVARADGLVRLALAAVARLVREVGRCPGAGIVVGEAFATLETDAAFHARIEDRGARMAEPRRFPYTSPNAAAGECGVAFGLTGPGFAVGGGPCAGLEALVVACDLVRSGDAERVVVVASDHVGSAVSAICERLGLEASSGAVALLVTSERAGAAWRVDETRLELGPWPEGRAAATGHRALLALTEPVREELHLSAGGPVVPSPGAWAVRATALLSSVSLGDTPRPQVD
jgi:3-oxoacyl-[acyl-carrier-protein] synthase-1/3-oxoacyl-[acyl-carrier-protein] synthase II